MSKADRLGRGASFPARPAPSARGQAMAAATDGRARSAGRRGEIDLELIGPNPDNPRGNLGDLTGLTASIREVGLVQPITVANVDAYLRHHPNRADALRAGTQYVVVDGHRRFEAARQAGAETIKAIINDGLVESDERLLEAAFVANVQRQNMSDLEEAQALEQLVAFYGSQRKAAERLGVSQGWISQRLSLLKLTPELQADLAAGVRTKEEVRNLGTLPPQEQKAAADERARKAEQAAAARREQRAAAPETPAAAAAGDYGVITPRAAEETPAPSRDALRAGGAPGDYAVITEPRTHEAPAAASRPVQPRLAPVPRPAAPAVAEDEAEAGAPVVVMPWRNPAAVADLLRSHMAADDIAALAKLLQEG